jgi:hypothetical protein
VGANEPGDTGYEPGAGVLPEIRNRSLISFHLEDVGELWQYEPGKDL